MYTKEISEFDVEFGQCVMVCRKCPKCGQADAYHETWESPCGGYSDDKFVCRSCGYLWWVDGVDS